MTTTTALAPQAKPCTEWCASHEPLGDICYTDDIILNFDAATPWMLKQFSAGLAAETDGRVIVQISINGIGPEEISPDDAERMGAALCAMAAAARRGGAR